MYLGDTQLLTVVVVAVVMSLFSSSFAAIHYDCSL